jgi:deferrochelatase/peroxidase EfeB
MNRNQDQPRATRRGFLGATAGLAATATSSGLGGAARALEPAAPSVEPFFGAHQSGILTPQQTHTYFCAFDLKAGKREDVAKLLREWTKAAAALSKGQPVDIPHVGQYGDEPDPADALGLPAARLTLTFGFGASLFVKDGRDRYGLRAQRPAAFVDLPNFYRDRMEPARTGGDLSVQACADNQQVAFHAIRQLSRIAYGVAEIRWAQAGFISDYGQGKTPRNLLGFKDGTGNPPIDDPRMMDAVVWVGEEGPPWMRGGSYLVARRARMALESWDRTKVSAQEKIVGRKKLSGAPLGADNEFDPIDLSSKNLRGEPAIPENSHVRLGHEAAMEGARVLRRAYSYNDGAKNILEPWPPFRREMEFDAGLIFICYQRDPRSGFIKIFEKMSRSDLLNQFVSHTGGGHFACPGGVDKDSYVGERLFEA